MVVVIAVAVGVAVVVVVVARCSVISVVLRGVVLCIVVYL